MFNADPTKSTDELLTEIKVAAVQGYNNANPVLSLPAFAALLVRLSRDADATAEKNLRIQRNLIRLTGFVLAISVVMLLLQFLQYSQI